MQIGALPGCQREFERKLGSIFAQPVQLERLANHTAFIGGQKTGQTATMPVPVSLRHQTRQRLSHDFLLLVTENLSRCLVPGDDISVSIRDDDGVIGGIHDGAVPPFADSQGVHRALLLFGLNHGGNAFGEFGAVERGAHHHQHDCHGDDMLKLADGGGEGQLLGEIGLLDAPDDRAQMDQRCIQVGEFAVHRADAFSRLLGLIALEEGENQFRLVHHFTHRPLHTVHLLQQAFGFGSRHVRIHLCADSAQLFVEAGERGFHFGRLRRNVV